MIGLQLRTVIEIGYIPCYLSGNLQRLDAICRWAGLVKKGQKSRSRGHHNYVSVGKCTSFVSIRPHSSAHSGHSSTQRPTLLSWPSIRSFTWQGLETSSWPSSRALDRPTPQRHWICSCQPLETDRPFYEAMVERRDGPSWLRDDVNDDGKCTTSTLIPTV